MAIELGKTIVSKLERRVCIPGISSAIFGFPLDLCAQIFGKTVKSCVDDMSEEDKESLPEIVLCNIDY